MTTITEPVFGNIPLSLIRESATNPRKYFDQAKLEELAESIRTSGVGQPILVRPHPDQENNPECVELVAGARRFRASQLAGRETIPAIVRDMTDQEVLEFQLVENLQRADVHEIEEADGYERLMKEYKLSADQVAEKVGKSRSYVFGRLKLLALTPAAREKFFAGQIDASTALLIARIPVPALQVKAMAEIEAGGVHWNGNLRNGPPMTYRQAKEHLHDRFMLKLDDARFEIRCVDLVTDCGSCEECPKRTGNQPEIYSDVEADICTDPDCFAAKCAAHDEKTIAAAKDLGASVYEDDEAEEAYEAGDYAVLDDHLSDENVKEEFDGNSIRELLATNKLTADQLPAPVAYAKLEDGLEPLYDHAAMKDALERAGILMPQEEVDKRAAENGSNRKADDKAKKELQKQKERMAAQHTLFNKEVYQAIKNSAAAVLHRPFLKMLLDFVLSRSGSYWLWKELGMEQSPNAEKLAYIDQLDDAMLQLLIIDAILLAKIKTEQWSIDDKLNVKDVKELVFLAKACGIDVEAIRRKYMPVDVKEKSQKKAAAPKQKKAKPVAEPAAQEQVAISAAPSTDIHLDDVVRVKDDARGPNKNKRKVAGKIGVVLRIQDDIYHVKFGTKSTDIVTNLKADELDKTEDQLKPTWWIDPAVAWPFPTGGKP